MDSLAITNKKELKAEIVRLRQVEDEQKAALAARFSSPRALFFTALTLFPKTNAVVTRTTSQDYVRLLARILLPLILNKMLFRHSNFIIKLLVGLISQQASGLITEDAVEKTIAKGKSLFGKLFHQKNIVPIQTSAVNL